MARIPVYNQQLTPSSAPANTRVVADQSGRGMQRIGDGVGDLARGLERRQQVNSQLERERIETEGRVWAANAASKADLDMAGSLEAATRSAKPGAAGFTPGFLKEYDKYAGEATKDAPSQFARDLLQAHLVQSREAFGRAAIAFEAEESTRHTGQLIDDGVGMSAKIVNSNPATFDREMGKWASTIGGAAIDEASKQKLRDLARGQLVNAAVVSWIDQSPVDALKALKASGDKAISWTDASGQSYQVPVQMGTLEERLKWSEYAERKVDKLRQDSQITLRYEIQNAEAMARVGVVPEGPARTRAEFGLAYTDPKTADYEYARYTTARQTAMAVASLSGKSTADLLSVIQARPDASDPNLAVTVNNQQIQAQAAAEIIRGRQADPVAYAIQSGDFGFAPLNPQDPAAFSEELKRRSAALPVMAEKYGTVSMLAKTEAEGLGKQLSALPADAKVEQLESIRTAIADDEVYASVLAAMRPDSPVTALVGNIAAVGSRENARTIALGEDLLNPKDAGGKGKFPMPVESQLRAAWVSSVGDAYRGYPEAEETAYQAYKAFYAATAAGRGLNDPAAGVDTSIADEAVAASTGGVMRWETDWFGNDTPSASIVLPYGMGEDVFRDRITAEWGRVREDLGYPGTDIGDIGLYNTGSNGEYMVMSGSSWLPDKDGKPVMLRVK